ncbi:MAG: NADH-quinone oxidoreductase subunit M [Planctomycetes bacterium]|nr:NADH-quinone oxidoreductase subunit M [Planctomycetota bacterium]
MTDHLLSIIVFLPTLGALVCMFAPKDQVRKVGVVFTLATFVLSLTLFGTFFTDGSAAAVEEAFGSSYGTIRHMERHDWIVSDSFTIEYYLGIDGLGFPLLVLTTFVSFLACVASWNFNTWKITKSIKAYFVLFLLLETGMLGVFVSLDFFLFYVFWEVMLLPMYFLIGVWGGERKEYAAIKFFLFTLGGSVLMLVGLVAMFMYSGDAVTNAMRMAENQDPATPAYVTTQGVESGYRTDGFRLTGGTFDLIELATNKAIQAHFTAIDTVFLGLKFAPVMFMFLFIGFAIKLPCVPVHTWLPDAHVEAPTPISMILAGVLLKMGGYGFLRLCYPIFPTGAEHWAFLLAMIGLVSIIYGALCAMAQTDFKRLVAYSSISHMGYVLLGLAVMTPAGFQGAMFQMIAHGISSPMCFFLVGVIYDRAHHREINRYGGLWLTMPQYGTFATIGFFASLGLPGLCGFIGEVWVLIGTFQAADKFAWAYPVAIIAAFGVVLTAGYILWLIRRVYLGKEREQYMGYPDATGREKFILVSFAVLCIAMGVLPMQTVFNFTNGTLNPLLAGVLAAQG